MPIGIEAEVRDSLNIDRVGVAGKPTGGSVQRFKRPVVSPPCTRHVDSMRVIGRVVK